MISIQKQVLAQFSGSYCVKNDELLSFVSDPAELAGLLGMTEEGIRRRCEGGFWCLAETAVRESLQREYKEQLELSEDIEFVFPVLKEDGSELWILNRGRLVKEERGEFIYGILLNVTHSKCRYDIAIEEARELQEQAMQDSLTKVYNASTSRKLAEEYLGNIGGGASCALLIVDLDEFKQVNDRHGHMFGDMALVQTANIIRGLFRSKDIVGRIGGDEFMILMKDISSKDIVDLRCRQVNEKLGEWFESKGAGFRPSCSIGVAFYPEQADSYFQLFCCADRALYKAKKRGRKQFAFYDKEDPDFQSEGSLQHFLNYDESVLRGYIE